MTTNVPYWVFSEGVYTKLFIGPLASRPAAGTAPMVYSPDMRNFTIGYIDIDTQKCYFLKKDATTGLATSWTS